MEEFEGVFEKSVGLPSNRRQDHSIVLKEGDQIPNLRPYRYPHVQINEIEKLVIDTLKSAILVVNKKKCNFAQKKAEYLSHIVLVERFSADPQKLVTMHNWPRLKEIKGLQGFLGLTDY